ncbi:hypothetical protein POM88_037871 [Heracleum sosnowskyi]|uniref:PGG domain-containing protein n=1 Tax=Heracleum sosnowskyi TaxID=360622 RepID=A0AAD8MGB5_9APIA|nr:hypothetical protein POM88_037871 [Heracleum sosnowskyi]
MTDEERVALVKQRLEERVLVNDEGNTALHEALLNDHKDIAEYLIKGNVEAAYYVNNQGKSPLYMAVAAGNTENIAMLQKITEKEPMLILLKDDKGLDPLEFASSIGFLEGVNFLQNGLKNPIQLRIEDIKKSEYWEGRHKRLKQLQDAEKVEISEEAPTHAGFTMPGGYSNSEPDEGMATLLNKLAFQVFVICDTIALYSAIMVAVTLIWAQLGDLTLVLNALKVAIPLLGISLTLMSLAISVTMKLHQLYLLA